MRLGPHVVTRKRGVESGPPYNEVDWTNPDELAVPFCSVQPGPPKAEITTDRDAVTTLWTVYAPGIPDVTERDRVEWQDDDYEVDGTIDQWALAPMTYSVIRLKAVNG